VKDQQWIHDSAKEYSKSQRARPTTASTSEEKSKSTSKHRVLLYEPKHKEEQESRTLLISEN
jgi:hypothetical protein